MNRPFLSFYADDFTGATDALEQLTRAGLRAVLFLHPPTPPQLARFGAVQAVGVAGLTRALAPRALEQEVRPALKKLKALGARHVHYKICSTFDSSPRTGSIGRVLDVARQLFPGPFVPLLVAAPALGRYTVFGNHFARYGTGSDGAVHRLDRHPAMLRHPVTPMAEADLRLHLARQTTKRVALFDLLQVNMPAAEARAALRQLLHQKPDAILFDALSHRNLQRVGGLLDGFASRRQPLFSIGSSGIEAALATQFKPQSKARPAALPRAAHPLLVGSGSCSPVTAAQIRWALDHGFGGVLLDPSKLTDAQAAAELNKLAARCAELLSRGQSVLVHTLPSAPRRRHTTPSNNLAPTVLGTALGRVLREVMRRSSVSRVCLAGGDTSSYAARALGLVALEVIATLTPGAPLCRVYAPGSPANGREMVFKGGQVGTEDYFGFVAQPGRATRVSTV